MEFDSEWNGEGAVYDYGFRVHDARLGRFLSVDPLAPDFPWYTPYQYAGNKVVNSIDLGGLEEITEIREVRETKFGTEYEIVSTTVKKTETGVVTIIWIDAYPKELDTSEDFEVLEYDYEMVEELHWVVDNYTSEFEMQVDAYGFLKENNLLEEKNEQVMRVANAIEKRIQKSGGLGHFTIGGDENELKLRGGERDSDSEDLAKSSSKKLEEQGAQQGEKVQEDGPKKANGGEYNNSFPSSESNWTDNLNWKKVKMLESGKVQVERIDGDSKLGYDYLHTGTMLDTVTKDSFIKEVKENDGNIKIGYSQKEK